MSSQGYTQARWKRARAKALHRAHHRCQNCGSTRTLRVHHIDGLGMSGPRATSQSNLRVLCQSCHKRAHDVMARGPDSTAVHIPNYRRD